MNKNPKLTKITNKSLIEWNNKTKKFKLYTLVSVGNKDSSGIVSYSCLVIEPESTRVPMYA